MITYHTIHKRNHKLSTEYFVNGVMATTTFFPVVVYMATGKLFSLLKYIFCIINQMRWSQAKTHIY